jgi:alpha-ketoglutarate-dependent 2,4-dichlorophenoxyacetate dioxygenase
MPISVTPLHPLFVGEISGVDLRRPLAPAVVAEIIAASDRHAILVFRDQDLADEEQIRFSGYFGTLERSPNYGRTRGQRPRLTHGELFDVSNLDETGNILAANDDRRMFRLINQLWHTDSSFMQVRGRYSLLSARIVPPLGADTEFTDLRAAYDALPPAMKAKLDGLVAEHFFAHSRYQMGFAAYSEQEIKARPPAHHPIVQTHPGSGRRTLYIAAHAAQILGMPVPEGRLLLMQLIEFATQPRFVYRHTWRVGDLVMWDNRCTMHRATPFDEATHIRDLRRTTVSDAA